MLALLLASTAQLDLAITSNSETTTVTNTGTTVSSTDSAAVGSITATTADPITSASADPSVGETLLLEVIVNGHSIGAIGEFTLYRGILMARPGELRDLGFRVPYSRTTGPGVLIALSDLAGLIWRLDLKNQQLLVTASNDALVPTVLQSGEEKPGPEGRRVIESGTGITLNYDTVGTFASGEAGVTTSLDLRGFSPWGIVSSEWLTFAGTNSGGTGKTEPIRLDTAYTYADVNSMRRYSLGDFIAGGLSWTRPFHCRGRTNPQRLQHAPRSCDFSSSVCGRLGRSSFDGVGVD